MTEAYWGRNATTADRRKVWTRRALVEGAWASVVVLAAVLLARAAPGSEAGATLGLAGHLRTAEGNPVAGAQRLSFAFRGPSGATCRPSDVQVTPSAPRGAFRAHLDLGACADTVFEGGELAVDVDVNGSPFVQNQLIAPAPLAVHAERTGSPHCPVGYVRESTFRAPDGGIADSGSIFFCRRGTDDVVKVGTGSAAFWVDRYEASLWTQRNGGGEQVSPVDDNYPATFPKNGQATNANLLFAASVANVPPNRYLTWFQANAACRASGKRLLHADEWLSAARGTSDSSSATSGEDGTCTTQSNAPRPSGQRTQCTSAWGAEDLIGNLWEWTADWHAGVSNVVDDLSPNTGVFGAGYRDDNVGAIASSARSEGAMKRSLPAAALRGGDFTSGTMAGKFALNLEHAPSSFDSSIGFRCAVDR